MVQHPEVDDPASATHRPLRGDQQSALERARFPTSRCHDADWSSRVSNFALAASIAGRFFLPLDESALKVTMSERPKSVSSYSTLEEQVDAAESAKVLAEFQAEDTIVIGVAFYNYSIPSSLKAWIDRVVVVGKTFNYTANGPVGYADDKRVILAIACTDVFSQGAPLGPREHAERYLRDILSLIGVDDLEVVVAEGLAYGIKASTASVQAMMKSIDSIPAALV